MKRAVGLHEEASVQRALTLWDERRVDERAWRAFEIAELPRVWWKGKMLYTIRCRGTSGRGSHLVHVPASLLWSLMDIRRYRCPYHAGDDLPPIQAAQGKDGQ